MMMTIDDSFALVTLSPDDQTFIQNNLDVDLIMRVDGDTLLKLYPNTRNGDGSYLHTNALGTLEIKVEEGDFIVGKTYQIAVL